MAEVHAILNTKAMNEITDIANRLWKEQYRPYTPGILFEALKQYLKQRGMEAPYTVEKFEE